MMTLGQLGELGDLLCRHYDKLPPGVDITSLRTAMARLVRVGHEGCRHRLGDDRCSVVRREVEVSDQDSKSV